MASVKISALPALVGNPKPDAVLPIVQSGVTSKVAVASLIAENYKDPARVATAGALPANTRTGNVLTASANGALPAQDGVSLVVDDRLLVKDEITGANNGIYVVTSLGDASNPWVLTRSADADEDDDVTAGMLVPVGPDGTVNKNKTFRLVTSDPITINVTTLNFAIDSNLTAPTNPGENDRVAYGSLGDLLYASGVRIASAGAALVVGSGTAPSGGDIRLPQNASIASRATSGNTANIVYLDSSDNLQIGETSDVDDTVINAGNSIEFNVPGDKVLDLSTGLVDCQDSEVKTTGYVGVGSGTLPSAGAYRVAEGGTIMGYGSSANRTIVYVSGAALVFGDDTINPIQIRSAGNTIFYGAGNPVASVVSSGRFRFENAVSTATVEFEQIATASITGGLFDIIGQNCTGSGTTGGSVRIRPGTGLSAGGEVRLADSAGTAQLTAKTGGVHVTNYVDFGTDPATTGGLRVPHGANMVGRNNVKSADVSLLDWGITATDDLYLGDASYDAIVRGTTVALDGGGSTRVKADSTGLGFFGATPVAKPTITGSRGGNAALASALTAGANLGLWTDSSTA